MFEASMNEQLTKDQDSINQTQGEKVNETIEKHDIVTFQNQIDAIKFY